MKSILFIQEARARVCSARGCEELVEIVIENRRAEIHPGWIFVAVGGEADHEVRVTIRFRAHTKISHPRAATCSF